jgi:hypothetical protein
MVFVRKIFTDSAPYQKRNFRFDKYRYSGGGGAGVPKTCDRYQAGFGHKHPRSGFCRFCIAFIVYDYCFNVIGKPAGTVGFVYRHLESVTGGCTL